MRLIDADELKKAIMLKEDVAYETWDELYDSVLEEIDNAPTIPTHSQKLGCEICVYRNIKNKEACNSPFGECEFFNATPDRSLEIAQKSIELGRSLGRTEERVKSERSQGKWVKIFENPFTNGYICSVCGHKIQVTEQFLPKITECEVCGAEMKGGLDKAFSEEVIKVDEPIPNSDEINKALEKGKLYKQGFEDAMRKFERPSGEWGEVFHYQGWNYHKCSNCHLSLKLSDYDNFCSNCGADMRKGGAE